MKTKVPHNKTPRVKSAMKVLLILFWFVFVVYLIPASPDFPAPPPGSVQSMELADSETSARRAYFTNYSREEVIAHYRDQMTDTTFSFAMQRLNYPPEDAQILIRDQTRSTFLEELSYPLRESLYINGFEPKVAKDEIWYKGEHFRQKITIKYVPNSVNLRLIIAVGLLGVSWALIREIFS